MSGDKVLTREELQINAVVSYHCTGFRGVGGQQVGADGSGYYSLIFHGKDKEAVYNEANKVYKKLIQRSDIKEVLITTSELGYFCTNPIGFILVKDGESIDFDGI